VDEKERAIALPAMRTLGAATPAQKKEATERPSASSLPSPSEPARSTPKPQPLPAPNAPVIHPAERVVIPETVLKTLAAQGAPPEPAVPAAAAQILPAAARIASPPAPQQHEITAIDSQKQQLENELHVLRREMNRLQSAKQATEHELLESRRSVKAFEQRLVKVKTTISYQLGSALVDSNKSWKGIMRLPARLVGVYRSSRALRRRSRNHKDATASDIARSTEAVEFIRSALAHVEQNGAEPAVAWAKKNTTKLSVLAYTYIEIARAIALDQAPLAAQLAAEALELYPIEQRAKTLAFLLGEQGHLRLAVALLEKAAAAGASFSTAEARTADYLRSLVRLLDAPPVVPPPVAAIDREHAWLNVEKRIAIIGREALPVSFGATALRLHARARAAVNAGWDVTVIAPPSATAGVTADHVVPSVAQRSTVEGVNYLRLGRVDQPEEVTDLYLSAMAASFASAVVATGARVLQAEATPVHGLAAALAARTLGLPLVLEIDDLIDPRAPYTPGFERSEKNQALLGLTFVAAKAADVCRVHHPGLIPFLEKAGISHQRIDYTPYRFGTELPSGADVAALAREIDVAGRPVIGVVRDLCDSYDTLVLVDMLAALLPEVQGLKLVVVGQGAGGDGLTKRATELGVGGSVVWVERPDASRIHLYRALMDVTIFTRRDTPRAALLSAHEVQAALACGRAVVGYRTADTIGLIEDGTTGWLCAPDDMSELKHKVLTLLNQPDGRSKLGTAARAAYLAAARKGHDDPLADLNNSVLGTARARADATGAASK
jgi:glycosyltransferase involved in cell wall biosynthesis